MDAGIYLEKIRSDDRSIEIKLMISDGSSDFRTDAWVGYADLAAIVKDLDRFKREIHGGIYDMRLGAFGPEFAGGALHARLHFYPPGHGRIYITVQAESGWHDFTLNKVASRATLYIKTEPALLDNFIEEFGRFAADSTDEAFLNCKT